MLNVIAPWIVESWSEFLLALSFDLPTLRLDPYQAHFAIAASALLFLAFAWHSVSLLPAAARIPMRGLLAITLLAPVTIFAMVHREAVLALPQYAHTVPAALPSLPSAARVAASVGDPPVATQAAPAPLPALAPQPAPAPQPAIAALEPIGAPLPVPVTDPPAKASSAMKRVVQTLTRLLPKAPAGSALMPVYFGTDRAGDTTAVSRDYTAARAGRLELGHAIIAIPATAGRMTVREIAALPRDDLLERVVLRRSRARRFPDQALVFVPGFNTSFEAALARTAQLASDLNFDGPAFVYSWPSAGRVAQYGYDRDSAQLAAPYLADFLRIVLVQSGAKSISIIAHGLGAGLALDALAGVQDQIPRGVEVRELILAAPDMERATFTAKAGALANAVRRTTLYVASSDRALNISRRFTGGVPRAGDVLEGGPLVIPGVDTIDVSASGTDAVGLNHPGLAARGALIGDIAALLQGGDERDPKAGGLERVPSPSGPYLRYSAHKVSAH